MPKRSKKKAPKPRHVWSINPRTRIKPSKKRRDAEETKDLKRLWKEEI